MVFDRTRGGVVARSPAKAKGFGRKLSEIVSWRLVEPGTYLVTFRTVELTSLFGGKDGVGLVFDVEGNNEEGQVVRGRARVEMAFESNEFAELFAALHDGDAADSDEEMSEEHILDRKVFADLNYREYAGRRIAVLSNFASVG